MPHQPMEINRSERVVGIQHHVFFPQNGLPYVEEITLVERGAVCSHDGRTYRQGWEPSTTRKRVISFASEEEYNAFYTSMNQ